MSALFVKDMLERAVKTFAQTLLATLAVATTLSDVDWCTALSTAVLAALISLLTSIVSENVGDEGTASVVNSQKGGKK